MELYPYLKVTINEDDFTLRLQCRHTRPAGVTVSRLVLSQPLCTHQTTGSHMLSTVDTWGRIQHFFKVLISHITIGSCSVSLTRMNWHPVTQKIKQSYTKNYNTLVYNINQARQSFSQWGFVPNCLMTACLIATDDVYIHHQCHQSIFPLIGFMLVL